MLTLVNLRTPSGWSGLETHRDLHGVVVLLQPGRVGLVQDEEARPTAGCRTRWCPRSRHRPRSSIRPSRWQNPSATRARSASRISRGKSASKDHEPGTRPATSSGLVIVAPWRGVSIVKLTPPGEVNSVVGASDFCGGSFRGGSSLAQPADRAHRPAAPRSGRTNGDDVSWPTPFSCVECRAQTSLARRFRPRSGTLVPCRCPRLGTPVDTRRPVRERAPQEGPDRQPR